MSHRPALSLESLETRLVPAHLWNGTLWISGTPRVDQITIALSDDLSRVTLVQMDHDGIPYWQQSFDASKVKAIHVIGGNGSDTLINKTSIDSQMFGGPGNDTLIGGSGRDELWGDEGSDNISGGGSDDLLIGGEDADGLAGDAGNDVLFGGISVPRGDRFDPTKFHPSHGWYSYNDDMIVDQLYGGAGSDIFVGKGMMLSIRYWLPNITDSVNDWETSVDRAWRL